MRRIGWLSCALVLLASVIVGQQNGEWLAYGRDTGGERYSPLEDINRKNVASLRIAWTFRTGDAYQPPRGRPTAFEATPLYVDGTLYLSTPLGRVIALDPVTGRQRWVFDAKVPRDAGYGDFASRGVSTWQRGARAPDLRRDDRRAPDRVERRHRSSPFKGSATRAPWICDRDCASHRQASPTIR